MRDLNRQYARTQSNRAGNTFIYMIMSIVVTVMLLIGSVGDKNLIVAAAIGFVFSCYFYWQMRKAERNYYRIIPHGIDTRIFKCSPSRL